MKEEPVIWMFSGQGSQYYQMGRDLYEQNPIFRQSMDHCSSFLKPLIGASLCEVIYQQNEDRFAPFDHTLYTHPAICSIQYSMAQTLLQQGFRPDYLLGYSVGEVAAHIMAGVFSLEEGLKLLVKQASLLETHSSKGSMMAILASPEMVENDPEMFQGTWIAARNFETHFIIVGAVETISLLHGKLVAKQINSQKLPVSHAFHSPLMDPIKEVFKTYLSRIPIAEPTIPTISATYGQRVEKTDPDFLWETTRSPIDFKKAIEALEAQNDYLYLDIGPSGTLATFVKYILRPTSTSETLSTITPFGNVQKNLDKLSC
ncbi:MAG: acyltransferase domain-containing protein [Kiritimatiellae bacterium]|nr:acyltransferase domain-containing protein [Kiritimatiellia bacterium]DAC82037.1 TPA_exp: acyltransferase [Kiritimatiellota bacterium]